MSITPNNEYELLLNDIIYFHKCMEHGNFILTSGIRDIGLIESAVTAPFQSIFGEDAYPTDIEKAAKLLYGLTKNHGFVDGNKRVATHAMTTLLDIREVELEYSQDELVELVTFVASSNESAEQIHQYIISWIKQRVVD